MIAVNMRYITAIDPSDIYNFITRDKKREEVEGKHTYQYVTLKGQVKERYSVIIICED